MEDDCDIIIIGAGIAGTACALRCARAGLSVLLLERAEIPGSKNLSGGRLYTHALAELLPQFHLTAPLERRITHESLSLLTPDGQRRFPAYSPAVNHGVYYVHGSIRGWLPKPKRRCRMHPRSDGGCTV